jgi:hypothetical protein
MVPHTEEIRRQLEESACVKSNFSGELIGRTAQFAEKSAAAPSRSHVLALLPPQQLDSGIRKGQFSIQ